MKLLNFVLATMLSTAISASALAAIKAYDLKINYSVNGVAVAAPHLVVKEGEVATMIQETNGRKTFLDVVANPSLMDGENVIFLDFKVGTISKSGEKTVVSTPQISTFESEKAKISVHKDDGTEEMSLSVVAVPKTL